MKMKRFRFLALAMALILSLSAVAAYAQENTAPVAENLEFTTYRGISIGGRLTAVDPDGDLLSFSITTAPTKGEIELNEDGRFVYTPEEGKRGKDYFGYKATDAQGNTSQEATVIIQIKKQKTKVAYSDTTGLACDYAAHLLAEEGYLVGQSLGGEYLFEPDRQMSRDVFLSLCMDIAGVKTLSGVSSTGFSDDADIPVWVKPYVSTALLDGFISGYAGENGASFDADACISRSEAAVMLNRVLNVTDVADTAVCTDGCVPAWASQAVANMSACDIMDAGCPEFSEGLTRGEAADMLARAVVFLEGK